MANFKADNHGQHVLLKVDFLEALGTNSFEYSSYRLLQREELVGEDVFQPHLLSKQLYRASVF